MSTITLQGPSTPLRGAVELPRSKSIANRLLVMQALCHGVFKIHGLPEATDTVTLCQALEKLQSAKGEVTLDVGGAGTAMRFLTALLATQGKVCSLTGDARMQARPIGPMVEALRSLGAEIEYTGKVGYPPLRFVKPVRQGGAVALDAGLSSQFVSALLLTGPVMHGGLTIRLKDKPVSRHYITMTLRMMSAAGVPVRWSGDTLHVPERSYEGGTFAVERDWSAAAFFYALAALSPKSKLTFPGLSTRSLQGDAQIAQIMTQLGITTDTSADKVVISSTHKTLPRHFSYPFTDCPDLVLPVAVACAGLGVPATLRGVHHLRYKESDRMYALQTELERCGVQLHPQAEVWMLRGQVEAGQTVAFQTYNDHRIAMSLASLVAVLQKVKIRTPEVVDKSFPAFWDAMEQLKIDIGQ